MKREESMKVVNKINRFYGLILSERHKQHFEKIIFVIAIIAFILHFCLVLTAGWGWWPEFFRGVYPDFNPIISLYTPFSIILIYEVFLLIYYLPYSITVYIGKQYEVMTLILIRKIFENLAHASVTVDAWTLAGTRNFLLTLGGLLLLFFLIFCFYKLGGHRETRAECETVTQWRFVGIKKILALILLCLFIILFVVSLVDLSHLPLTLDSFVYGLKSINNTFFQTFFTALILIEVLLLLFTFNLTDKFNKVIRNSGFIVSTTLLKISFSTEGLLTIGIILVAVLFGISILAIHRLFQKNQI